MHPTKSKRKRTKQEPQKQILKLTKEHQSNVLHQLNGLTKSEVHTFKDIMLFFFNLGFAAKLAEIMLWMC